MFSKIQKVVSQIQRKFLHRFDDFRFMSGGSATSSFDFGWRKHFSEKFFEWSARGEKTSKSHPNQSKSCEKRQICNQFYKFASLGSAPGTPSWQVQKFVRMGSHILTLCILISSSCWKLFDQYTTSFMAWHYITSFLAVSRRILHFVFFKLSWRLFDRQNFLLSQCSLHVWINFSDFAVFKFVPYSLPVCSTFLVFHDVSTQQNFLP